MPIRDSPANEENRVSQSAIKVGTTTQGVEWICYRHDGESDESFENRADSMAYRFNVVNERQLASVVKVSGLTTNQMDLVQDELSRRDENPLPVDGQGKSWISAPRETFHFVAEGLEFKLEDEDEIRWQIEGAAWKDLTEAQVDFGVQSAVRSIQATIAKLEKVAGS